MGYGAFADASPVTGDDQPGKQAAGARVKSCQSNIALHRVMLTVLPGEGPIRLEKRLRRMLPGTPVSWAAIVQQNKAHFGGVTSAEDIRNFDYRNNRDLKPGDIITFEYYTIEPVVEAAPAQPAPSDLATIIDPVTGNPLKLAVTGSLKSSSSFEVVFGIDSDLLEAKVGIGMEVFTEGKFVLDRKGLSGKLESKFKFFVEGEAGFDIGALKWEASARATYEPSSGNFEFSLDRDLEQRLKPEAVDKFNESIAELPKKKAKGKKVRGPVAAAISYNYFHFEYDREANVTRIGVTVTVKGAVEGTVELGSPFIQLKLSTGGEGTISFLAEVPGDQSHLKPTPVDVAPAPTLQLAPPFQN